MKALKLSFLLFFVPFLLLTLEFNPNSKTFWENRNLLTFSIDTNVVIKKIYGLSKDSVLWDTVNVETFDYNAFAFKTLQIGIGNIFTNKIYGFVGEDTLFYDQNNRIIEEHYRSIDGSLVISKVDYNTDNNVIRRTRKTYPNSDLTPPSILIFYFEYQNGLITYIYRFDSDSINAVPLYRSYYFYSNINLDKSSITDQYLLNGVWQDSTKINYEYSKTGKETHSYEVGGSWESWSEYDTIADQLIHYKMLRNYGQLLFEDTYKYNSEGMIIYEENSFPFGGLNKKEYFYVNNRLDSLQDWSLGDFDWNYTATKYIYKDNLLVQEMQNIYSEYTWEEYYKKGIIDYIYRKITEVHEIEQKDNFIIISPNPATDFIEISVVANGPSPLQSDIKILNVFGQTVLSVGAIHELPLQIEVSSLAIGIYFVRIGDRVCKFVKI